MGILELENITYSYTFDAPRVINDISYGFEESRVYCIVGKSGAGKTTLLSLLSGLTNPTNGRIFFNGKDISQIDSSKYRSQSVGVIFQSYNLLPHYNALENVILSLDVSEKHFENTTEKAKDTLEAVGLTEDKIYRKILKLSGGEQQRVAIARALSYDPKVILADEPTGNLDLGTQEEILNIFKKLAYDHNKCVIIVTHSPEVAKSADEIYTLSAFVEK